jgi:hypothetical protein
VVVRAYNFKTKADRTGVFGSLETAQAWERILGADFNCVFDPCIVDDPDWGNEAIT